MDTGSTPELPNSLVEEIYVNGSDTVIRISQNTVLIQTNRPGGIQLPALKHGRTAEIGHDSKHMEGTVKRSERLITDEDIFKLANKIDDDWKSLALCHLNVPATEVESIIQQNTNLRDQKFCMLRRWKSRLEQDATVKNLLSAIDQQVGKEKWGFLLDDETVEETSGLVLKHDETTSATVGNDEDLSMSSIESEDLPPISLASGGHVTEQAEDVQVQENEPLEGLDEPRVDDIDPEGDHDIDDDDKGQLEHAQRLSVIHTEGKQDQLTSIGIPMNEIVEKILGLDTENKKLKTENTKLKKEKVEQTEELQIRSEDAAQSVEECMEDNDGRHRCKDFKKQRLNYLKVKSHLKKALEANQEWDAFCRTKRDRYKKDLNRNMELIKSLEEKLKIAETVSSDSTRQIESILDATETQVTATMNELEKVKAENKKLKFEIHRVTEEKRKVEKFSRELLKAGGNSSRRDAIHDKRPVNHEAPPVDRGGSETYHEVLQMVEQAKYPPAKNDRGPSRERTKAVESDQDDIAFLKKQILQYRDDFERERRDREKAAAELASLRADLEAAQLMLQLQKEDYPYAGSDGTQQWKTETRQKGFKFMDPEEVQQFRESGGW